MRLGDSGDYEDFGTDLGAVADVLADVCAVEGMPEEGSDIHRTRFGIVIPGHFEGNNYVSLYWGDDDPNGVREITGAELDMLRGALS